MKKLNDKVINCSNCGCKGHSYRYCNEPIQSLGVIVFKVDDSLTKEYSWDSIRETDKSTNHTETRNRVPPGFQ